MPIADAAADKVLESLNADDRSAGHVAAGIAICVALIGVTAAVSVARPQPPAPGAKPSRHPWVRAIWPSLFSVTTLAALRVWNAPASPARTRALGLWTVLQASTIAMTLWRPKRRGEQVVAAAATAALTAAYAHSAANVDQKPATLTAPTGFAGRAALAATPAK